MYTMQKSKSKLWCSAVAAGIAVIFLILVLTWHHARTWAEQTFYRCGVEDFELDKSAYVEWLVPDINPTETLTGKYAVCYYTLPSENGLEPNLYPASINPQLCTHLIVGFASVVNCTLTLGINDTKIYEDVVRLKDANPSLNVMMSVGGADGGSGSGFPEMVRNHTNRKIFIRSVMASIKKLQLDGIDLDWEFPAWRDDERRQKIHFVQLLYELRKAFAKSNQRLILSVAVAAAENMIDQCYMVPEMAEYVDFVNVMTYDYHFYSWYQPFTGHNAPLLPSARDASIFSTMNVNYTADYWVQKGMPREKIMIGVPTFGHSFRLINSDNHELQAPCDNFGTVGDKGFVSYKMACEFLRNGATRIFDFDSLAPYAYQDDEWMSYDDIFSILYKVDWIKSSGFGGAMIFSLNTDDWDASCARNLTFPLTRVVRSIIHD